MSLSTAKVLQPGVNQGKQRRSHARHYNEGNQSFKQSKTVSAMHSQPPTSG
jgi:hypothetical protein